MSQSACSMPLIADIPSMPTFQKCCRYAIWYRCSIRSGSSPTSNSARSSIAPATVRVFHSRVASPQPYKPGSSVSTLTKIQFRILALTINGLILVIFTLVSFTKRRTGTGTVP